MPGDAAVIAILIMERPMCLECIATKSRLSTLDVERYLDQISQELEVRQESEGRSEGRCRICGEPRTVFWLSRVE